MRPHTCCAGRRWVHLPPLFPFPLFFGPFRRVGRTEGTPLASSGATGRVGDPSGKSTERPVMTDDVIERNVSGIGGILQKLLTVRRLATLLPSHKLPPL